MAEEDYDSEVEDERTSDNPEEEEGDEDEEQFYEEDVTQDDDVFQGPAFCGDEGSIVLKRGFFALSNKSLLETFLNKLGQPLRALAFSQKYGLLVAVGQNNDGYVYRTSDIENALESVEREILTEKTPIEQMDAVQFPKPFIQLRNPTREPFAEVTVAGTNVFGITLDSRSVLRYDLTTAEAPTSGQGPRICEIDKSVAESVNAFSSDEDGAYCYEKDGALYFSLDEKKITAEGNVACAAICKEASELGVYACEDDFNLYLVDITDDEEPMTILVEGLSSLPKTLYWPTRDALIAGFEDVDSGEGYVVVYDLSNDLEILKESGASRGWRITDPCNAPRPAPSWPISWYFDFFPPWNAFVIACNYSSSIAIVGKWEESNDDYEDFGYYAWSLIHSTEGEFTSRLEVAEKAHFGFADRPLVRLSDNSGFDDRAYVCGAVWITNASQQVDPLSVLGNKKELEGVSAFPPPPTLLVASSIGLVHSLAIVDKDGSIDHRGAYATVEELKFSPRVKKSQASNPLVKAEAIGPTPRTFEPDSAATVIKTPAPPTQPVNEQLANLALGSSTASTANIFTPGFTMPSTQSTGSSVIQSVPDVKQTENGVFGISSANTNPPLFPSNASKQQLGGGIFGSNPPSVAGIFGSNPPSVAGIFGSDPPSVAGIFGSNPPSVAGTESISSGIVASTKDVQAQSDATSVYTGMQQQPSHWPLKSEPNTLPSPQPPTSRSSIPSPSLPQTSSAENVSTDIPGAEAARQLLLRVGDERQKLEQARANLKKGEQEYVTEQRKAKDAALIYQERTSAANQTGEMKPWMRAIDPVIASVAPPKRTESSHAATATPGNELLEFMQECCRKFTELDEELQRGFRDDTGLGSWFRNKGIEALLGECDQQEKVVDQEQKKQALLWKLLNDTEDRVLGLTLLVNSIKDDELGEDTRRAQEIVDTELKARIERLSARCRAMVSSVERYERAELPVDPSELLVQGNDEGQVALKNRLDALLERAKNSQSKLRRLQRRVEVATGGELEIISEPAKSPISTPISKQGQKGTDSTPAIMSALKRKRDRGNTSIFDQFDECTSITNPQTENVIGLFPERLQRDIRTIREEDTRQNGLVQGMREMVSDLDRKLAELSQTMRPVKPNHPPAPGPMPRRSAPRSVYTAQASEAKLANPPKFQGFPPPTPTGGGENEDQTKLGRASKEGGGGEEHAVKRELQSVATPTPPPPPSTNPLSGFGADLGGGGFGSTGFGSATVVSKDENAQSTNPFGMAGGASAKPPVTHETQLRRFYEQVDKNKASEAGKLVQKYAGQEAKLWQNLKTKYPMHASLVDSLTAELAGTSAPFGGGMNAGRSPGTLGGAPSAGGLGTGGFGSSPGFGNIPQGQGTPGFGSSGFGAVAAGAPSTGGFAGLAAAPPAGGGGFGSLAQSGGGGFGSSSWAQPSGGVFGSTAPAPGMGGFGTPQAPAMGGGGGGFAALAGSAGGGFGGVSPGGGGFGAAPMGGGMSSNFTKMRG